MVLDLHILKNNHRLSKILSSFAALMLTTAVLLPEHVFAQDAAGCQDNPIVSRFHGSTLLACQQKSYEESLLPLGIWKNNQATPSKSVQVSGKTSYYFYSASKGVSGLEIFRNYEMALSKAGFSTSFQCNGTYQCGWELQNHEFLKLNDFAGAVGTSSTSLAAGIDGVFHTLTAHLNRPQGNVDLLLMVTDEDDGQKLAAPTIYLKVIESKPMNTGEVTVDAKAIGKSLAQNGHIALYGIHFATDKATIEESSASTLTQMAKMLKEQPNTKVFIVGHTDNTGILSHNLALSKARAEAVVKALSSQYGIAASRLSAQGVASFAPVASNEAEAGRALNRRVEMVLQ